MKQPRFMLAAPSSGSGKTMITCGILQILKNRGYRVSSFKCGPDYIDPMFHTKVLGTISRNLDTFFTGEEMTRCLFAKTAQRRGERCDAHRGCDGLLRRTWRHPHKGKFL